MGNILTNRHPQVATPQTSLLGKVLFENRVCCSMLSFYISLSLTLHFVILFSFLWVLWKNNEYGVVNYGKNGRMPLRWEKSGLAATWSIFFMSCWFHSKHSSVIPHLHFHRFPSANIDCLILSGYHYLS